LRHNLKELYQKRTRFTAIFEKFGEKEGYNGYISITILLTDLKELDGDEKVLTDHIWMNYGKQFKKLELSAGDLVAFNARVTIYEKGYSIDSIDNPKRTDYKLERPTKIEKIGRSEENRNWDSLNKYNEEKLNKIKFHNERLSKIRKDWKEKETAASTPVKIEKSKGLFNWM
jgi:hypothetical protein